MRDNLTYYFSVEGETEKWYLDWLQSVINADSQADHTVKLDSKIEKNPLSRVKGLTILGETNITHIFDRESEDEEHVQQFKTVLNQMKAAENLGKSIKYHIGYCNFTFEL